VILGLVTLGLVAVVVGLVIYLAAMVTELATLVRFLVHGTERKP
jgi:hypothetical protein